VAKNSKAKIAANNRNTKNHYDRLPIFTTKEHGAEIRAAADAEGKTLNSCVMEMFEAGVNAQNKADDTDTVVLGNCRQSEIQTFADTLGESLNDFINKAIVERLERLQSNEVDEDK
jgi:uncharacterized protein (DUF1778 family)